jgi:hypothetical protein
MSYTHTHTHTSFLSIMNRFILFPLTKPIIRTILGLRLAVQLGYSPPHYEWVSGYSKDPPFMITDHSPFTIFITQSPLALPCRSRSSAHCWHQNEGKDKDPFRFIWTCFMEWAFRKNIPGLVLALALRRRSMDS